MAPDRVIAALETLDRRDRRRNAVLALLVLLAAVASVVAGLALWFSSQSHSNDEQAISTLAFRLCQHDLNDALDTKFRQDVRAFFAASTPASRTVAIAALATPEPKIHLEACGPVKLYEITVPVPVPVSPTGPPTSPTTTTLTQGIPFAPVPARGPVPTTMVQVTTTTGAAGRRDPPASCTTVPVTKTCLP